VSQVSKRLRETDLIRKAFLALERSNEHKDLLAEECMELDLSDTNEDVEEEQWLPGPVDLPETVDGITTGETHSVAYSTKTNTIYFWGLY